MRCFWYTVETEPSTSPGKQMCVYHMHCGQCVLSACVLTCFKVLLKDTIHATAPGTVCPPVGYSVTLSLAGVIHIVYLSGCLVAKCK